MVSGGEVYPPLLLDSYLRLFNLLLIMIKQIVYKWSLNVLISIDQLGNTIAGGDPDETISSRLGKLKVKHGGTIPWYRPMSGFIDWCLDKIDPNHSIDAIEKDEGDNAILDKESK